MATEEQTNAQIVVSADTTQYQQSVQAAAQETSKLNEVVGSLGRSLDGLTSKIGKRIAFGGSAALLSMAAAAKIAADYDKQLFTLKGTASYTGESVDKLGKSITDIAKKFPVARTEVIGLYESFTQLGQKAPAELKKLSESAILLGGATGENINALATSLGELNRSFGTLNSGQFERFGSALTSVSKMSGASATGIASFAQSLAPISKAAGITENQVLGISAAFSAAGADGFAASNTFNTIVADITRQIQYGSPEISKYANVLGLTAKEFKSLGTTEGVTQLFEYISKQGPNSIKILDQLGIDGIRASKAITAVAQQGGIRKYIAGAEAGYDDPDKMKEAGKKAFEGLSTSVDGIKKSFQEIGEALGATFLPAVAMVAKILDKVLQPIASIVRLLVDNPLGKAFGTAVVAGTAFLTVVGLILTQMKLLSTLVGASFIVKSTPVQSLIGGFRESRAAAQGVPFITRNATEQAAMTGALAQRAPMAGLPFWRVGNALGQGAETGGASLARGIAARAVVTTANTGSWLFRNFGTNYANDARNDGAMRNTTWRGGDPLQKEPGRLQTWGSNLAARSREILAPTIRPETTTTTANGSTVVRAAGSASAITTSANATSESSRFSAAQLALKADLEKAKAGVLAAQADIQKARASGATVAGESKLLQALTATSAEASAALQTLAKSALRAAGTGVASGLSIGAKVGGSLMSTLAMTGLTNPWLLGAAAVGGGFYLNSKSKNSTDAETDISKYQGFKKYDEALGIASKNVNGFTDSLSAAKKSLDSNLSQNQKFATALSVSTADKNTVAKNTEYINKDVSMLKTNDQAKSWLSAQGKLSPEELQLIKEDLLRNGSLSDVQGIISSYDTKNPNAKFDPAKLIQQAIDVQSSRSPLARGYFQGKESKYLVDTAIGGIATNASDIGQKYGADAELAYRAKGYNSLFDTLFANNSTVAGSRKSPESSPSALLPYVADPFGAGAVDMYGTGSEKDAASVVADNTIKTIEKQLGLKEGTLKTPEGTFKTKDEYLKAFYEYNSGDEATKQKLDDAGFNKTGTELADAYSMAVRGTDEKTYFGKLAGSSLGSKLLGNKNSDGEYTGAFADFVNQPSNPQNQRAAQALLLQESGFGNDLVGAQQKLQDFANSIDNVNDPAYQAAKALQALAAQIETIRASYTTNFVGQQAIRGRQADVAAGNTADSNSLVSAQTSYEQIQADDAQFLIARVKQFEAFNLARDRQERDYNKSVLRNKKAFNLSMERSEADYQLSVARSDEDYNRQRAYSVEDYNRQRERSEYNFQKGQTRAIEDFNKSRMRAMRDYNKQLARMVEDAASSMYDPYQRITAKATWDGRNLISNMQEQARKIREQVANIEKLKQAGLSQQAIDQLGLADASNAQQTASLASQVGADPTLAAGLNQAAGSKQASAQELLVNDSNKTYRRMRDDFNQSLADSESDFKKAMARQQEDYQRSLRQQDEDFNRSLTRQDESYNRNRERGRLDHEKAMRRARTDQKTALRLQNDDFLQSRRDALEDLRIANEEIFVGPDGITALAARANAAVKASGIATKNSIIANNRLIVADYEKTALKAVNVQAQASVNQFNSSADAQGNARQLRDQVTWIPGPGGKTKGGSWNYPPDYRGPKFVFGPGNTPLDSNGRGMMAKGGIMTNRQRVDFAEDGPELAIPLNQQGINFLKSYITQSVSKDAIKQMMVGSYGSPVEFKGQGNVYNDNSTQVNGPITVVSNDPNDMANKIAAKARYNRLTSRK